MRALPLVLVAATVLTLPASAADATAPPVRATAIANVEIVDFAFRPGYTRIEPGDRVVWDQTSPDVHTVTSGAGAPEAFDSGELQPGATFSRAFPVAGRYAYHCTIHDTMQGVVQVGPDTVKPKLTKVKAKRGKRGVKVSFRLSEPANVSAVAAATAKPSKVLRRVKAKALRAGGRSLTVKTKGLKPGGYRVTVKARDLEGNLGTAKVRFKIPAPK